MYLQSFSLFRRLVYITLLYRLIYKGSICRQFVQQIFVHNQSIGISKFCLFPSSSQSLIANTLILKLIKSSINWNLFSLTLQLKQGVA